MLSLGQVRQGSKIIFNNAPFEVVSVNHIKMGRGQAKLATKLRNLLSGAIIDQTFQGNDRVEEAEVTHRDAQFLYEENNIGHFMATDNFEQLTVNLTEAKHGYLKEGAEAIIVYWQSQPIDLKLPTKVELKVTYTEPGFRGDTSSSPSKPATLETGKSVQVPLFVKVGDMIRINTETGTYDSRV